MQQDNLASIYSYLRPVLNQYLVQFSHLVTVAILCDRLARWQQFNNRARLRLLSPFRIFFMHVIEITTSTI